MKSYVTHFAAARTEECYADYRVWGGIEYLEYIEVISSAVVACARMEISDIKAMQIIAAPACYMDNKEDK